MTYTSPVFNSFQWTLDIDLQSDFAEKACEILQKAGYKGIDKNDAVYHYFNLLKRQIEKRPRQVVYSREFRCPQGYENALKEFETKVIHGENLLPFMSTKMKDSSYNDLLLFDWGVQHFHLSKRYRSDGFVQRSDYEIFSYVTDETLYMIQIYHHKSKYLFSKQEIVKIIRDNWPELIERFRLKGVMELTEKIDDSLYEQIRKAHAITCVELGPNEVYGMIGGGYSSNGMSTDVVRNRDYWNSKLKSFQTIIIQQANWIGKTINTLRGRTEQNAQMEIRLLWIDNAEKITLYEKNYGLVLQILTKENLLRICEPHELFGF